MRMLEVGCGNLRAGRLFIEHLDARDYYGIDISPDILLAAQRTAAEAGPAQTAAPDPGPGPEAGVPPGRVLRRGARAQRILALPHRGHRRVPGARRPGHEAGRLLRLTFDRTEGAEHHVLREDFYYQTETLVALAGTA